MEVLELFMLLANDLLVLELEQLTLLLEVSDNLAQALLKQVDLRLEKLNLLSLFKLALGVLLHRQALGLQLVLGLVIVQLELRVPVVQIGQLFVLELGLLTKAEVLDHDIPLDLRDVFLSFLDGILPEVIKKLGVMRIDLLLLSLTILHPLLLHLIVETEEHLVTVFLVFNLLFLHHLGVFELSQLFFGLQERLHLSLSLLLLEIVALDHVRLLSVEPNASQSSG